MFQSLGAEFEKVLKQNCFFVWPSSTCSWLDEADLSDGVWREVLLSLRPSSFPMVTSKLNGSAVTPHVARSRVQTGICIHVSGIADGSGDLSSPSDWQISFSQSAPGYRHAHLPREARGLSKYHCNVNKTRSRFQNNQWSSILGLCSSYARCVVYSACLSGPS